MSDSDNLLLKAIQYLNRHHLENDGLPWDEHHAEVQALVEMMRPAMAPNDTSWRTGRSVGNTIYHGDRFIGSAVTPEDAKALVDAANHEDSLSADDSNCNACMGVRVMPKNAGPNATLSDTIPATHTCARSNEAMQELCRQLRNDQQPSEELLTAALGPEDTSPGPKGRDFEQMAEDFLKESGCSVDIDPQDFDVIATDLAVRFKEVYEQGQKSK